MFRARLAALTVSAGLALISGCGMMSQSGGGLFDPCRPRLFNCFNNCGCCGGGEMGTGMTAYGSPTLIDSTDPSILPAPAPVTSPQVGNPPRVVPIPQATPMPYTPQ